MRVGKGQTTCISTFLYYFLSQFCKSEGTFICQLLNSVYKKSMNFFSQILCVVGVFQ